MPFNWAELLLLAEDLHSGKMQRSPSVSRECFLRTVCSRAYYAVYCITRDFEALSHKFSCSKSNSVHEALYQHLRTRPGIDPIVIRNFNELRQSRVDCDYNNPFKRINRLNLEAEASKAIHSAKTIINGHCGNIT